MVEACRRCLVSGRVQGVGFRYATRERANALGVEVRARNLADGRVEVLARGSAHALESLCNWLQQGPSHARVAGVRCEDLPLDSFPAHGD